MHRSVVGRQKWRQACLTSHLHRHRYMSVRKTSNYKQLNFLSMHRLVGGKVGVSLNRKV